VRSLINAALLLGQGGVDVQHERISISAQLSDDEGHALRHSPSNDFLTSSI
jgi:hypothetical protein